MKEYRRYVCKEEEEEEEEEEESDERQDRYTGLLRGVRGKPGVGWCLL